MKILSFGEIIFDIYGENHCLGGAPLNFIAHCVKREADGSLVSAVGNDYLGKTALEMIKAYGIEDSYIHVSENFETGKCIVTLNGAGVPQYNLAENTAYDYIPVPETANRCFDVLYFGSLALRSEHNKETLKTLIDRKVANEVLVDINIRPPFYNKENLEFCLKNANILKVSDEELPLLSKTVFGDSENFIQSIKEAFKNIKMIILTCGAKGSIAYDLQNNKTYTAKAVPTRVVSTVGAGDSFSAAFICEYLKESSIEKCLEEASKLSAFVVAHKEAIP